LPDMGGSSSEDAYSTARCRASMPDPRGFACYAPCRARESAASVEWVAHSSTHPTGSRQGLFCLFDAVDMKRRKDIRRSRNETSDICDGQWLRETAPDDEEGGVPGTDGKGWCRGANSVR
jgi:hypothetical protein